jgi:hypothetical protein
MVPAVLQTEPLPLVGPEEGPPNQTTKQRQAYENYRTLNNKWKQASEQFNTEWQNFQSERARFIKATTDLDILNNQVSAAINDAGTTAVAEKPGSVARANALKSDYEKLVRTIDILMGLVDKGSRTAANSQLAKASLAEFKSSLDQLYDNREAAVVSRNAAVAAIGTANTEAAEQAARNARTKAEEEAARVAKQLADAQAAQAAQVAAASASGAAAAFTASAARASAARAANNAGRAASAARAANNAGRAASAARASAARAANNAGRAASVVRAANNAGRAASAARASAAAASRGTAQASELANIVRGRIDKLKKNADMLENSPKKAPVIARIDKLKANAAMLGGYRKKGRSTRRGKKRNSGKKTYRRKF